MPESQTTSAVVEQLVREAAAGDRQARQRLLARYWPLVRQVVLGRRARLGRLLGREDTDDLLQQAAIALLDSLERHEWRGRQAFAAWVRRVADCEVRDVARFHGRGRRRLADETHPTDVGHLAAAQTGAETRADRKQALGDLETRLRALKPEYAAAVTLSAQGYSHAEIGELLGCTPEAARKLVARGRAKLVP